MGWVKMSEKVTAEWEDLNGIYPYATATLYIYCDRCGSFSIKSRIGYKKALLIIAACILIAVGTLAALQHKDGLYWLFLCIGICILAFRYLWGDPNYVCRKCGGIPKTDYNILGYPSDIEILDVPDGLTQKHYIGYFPEDNDLDNILSSPEVHPLKNREGPADRIFQDIESIKNLVFYIIFIPLLMIYLFLSPYLIVIHWLWTEGIPKIRKHNSNEPM